MASFLGKLTKVTILSCRNQQNNLHLLIVNGVKTCVNTQPGLILRFISSNCGQFKHVNPILRPQLGIQENVSMLQLKKRTIRRKKVAEDEMLKRPGDYGVVAFTTAEEYNLEALTDGLKQQDLYEPKYIENANNNVIYATAKYSVETEPREMFIFREGSVVLWNITDLESSNVLSFLKKFEHDSYSERMVQEECEIMNYRHQNVGSVSIIEKNGDFSIAPESDVVLDKFAFSNAMVLSVKLGMWETSLDKYIDTIEFVTEDLKMGRKIRISREDVLRKQGELFALRHQINLSSDLLDTPDFYWDNDELERLYLQVCSHFCISKRTRVMNEKISHCVELLELLSTHLSDKHHIRLEWMIIVLIMVEVAFETIHYLDRFYS